MCGCCYMEAQPNERVEMECNHALCSECYSDYLVNVIKRGPDCLLATCPREGCKLVIPEDMYRKLVPESELQKYQQYYRESFIIMSRSTKWCPNPKCKKAINNPSQS